MAAGRPDYTSQTRILGLGPTGTLITLAVDASGNLVALVKGTDGVSLHTVAVDSGGQIIMVPRGQSGNYMAVDASGNLTTVMKGVDGVTLRTVAVDASGNIIGVLKGDYEGSLQTLAVDAQGRMLAVLTDPEDVFGNPHYMGAAELAARLGALSTWDRRGQMLWADDFEHYNTGWEAIAWGTGAAIDLSTDYVLRGRRSIRLTAGSDGERLGGIFRRFPYLTLSKYGLEASMKLLDASSGFRLDITHLNGVNRRGYQVLYNPQDSALYYWTGASVWVPFASGVTLPTAYAPFHYLKLVVDLVNNKYVRFQLNNTVYNMSTYTPVLGADTAYPYIEIAVYCYSAPASDAWAFLDSVILTQNEPVN